MVELSVKGLSKSYGGVNAVKDVSFTIEDGSIMTLLGPSGCGKTTTLRCIAGLEKPDKGLIKGGERILFSSEQAKVIPAEKRNMGMVFQSYAIWPHMSVFKNIAYPLKIRKEKDSEIRSKVKEVVNMVQLEGLEDRPATALSGGQQQRVAFARAIVAHPDFLLLDEPMSNLDARLRESMRHELRRLQKNLKITTIYVTHDQIEALFLSHKIGIMDRGELIQSGTPQEIYSSPKNSNIATFLGQTNLMNGNLLGIEGDQAKVETKMGVVGVKTTNKDLGKSLTICIRPENVQITKERNFERNTFQGTIVSAAYFGDYSEFEVRCQDTTVKLHTSEDVRLEEHDQAWVYLPSNKITILPS